MAFACKPVSAADSWRLVTRGIKNATSQTFTAGSLTFASSGTATQTTVTAMTNCLGIGMSTIGSSDAAYSTSTFYPYLAPKNGLESEFVCPSTGTTYGEGACCDVSSAAQVNCAADSVKVIMIKRKLSTTAGIFAINRAVSV